MAFSVFFQFMFVTITLPQFFSTHLQRVKHRCLQLWPFWSLDPLEENSQQLTDLLQEQGPQALLTLGSHIISGVNSAPPTGSPHLTELKTNNNHFA